MSSKGWSEDLINQTREYLPHLPRPHVKNYAGRYGISKHNEDDSYVITLFEGNMLGSKKEKYESLDALIEAGWAID